MASSEVTSQLGQAETASPSQRSDAYASILSKIINQGGTNLAANIVAYVQSILSDNIGVIHSRPLLSAFVEQYRNLANNEAKIEAGTAIVDLLAPRIVSYEQQDTEIKFILADAYGKDEDFGNSAKTLQAITLDSSQRNVSDDDKAKVWMRICRCYIEEDDTINALTYLNRVKQVIYSVTDQTTRLEFQLSQARIYDSQRNFLDASDLIPRHQQRDCHRRGRASAGVVGRNHYRRARTGRASARQTARQDLQGRARHGDRRVQHPREDLPRPSALAKRSQRVRRRPARAPAREDVRRQHGARQGRAGAQPPRHLPSLPEHQHHQPRWLA